MVIWLILIAAFISGIVITINGTLKTSKRRHIVGRNARLVGVGLIALTPMVLIVTVIGTAVSLKLGHSTESADTYGNVAGVAFLSICAFLFAANVKRLSVPIPTARPKVDLSNIPPTVSQQTTSAPSITDPSSHNSSNASPKSP